MKNQSSKYQSSLKSCIFFNRLIVTTSSNQTCVLNPLQLKMMTFNIVTIFSASERSQLKKAFQANQKKKALVATPTYFPKNWNHNQRVKAPSISSKEYQNQEPISDPNDTSDTSDTSDTNDTNDTSDTSDTTGNAISSASTSHQLHHDSKSKY